MITESFLDIWFGFCSWVIDMFPTDPPPDFLTGMGGFITDLFNGAAGLGAWFPFDFFGFVAFTVVTLWLVFWAIKGLRWVYGLTPFAGGT